MLYRSLLAVHVTAAVVAFGAVFAAPLLRRTVTDRADLARAELLLVTRLMTPAMTVLLAAGLTLVAVGPRGLTELWVSATLAILLALFAVAGAGLARTARALLGAGSEHADAGQLALRMSMYWQLCAGLVVVAIFLMVVKPGS